MAASGRAVPLAILQRWAAKSDDIAYLVLSHPHDDHVEGIADVINGRPPLRIAVAGTLTSPRYIDMLANAPMPTTTDDRVRVNAVRTALAAIRTWERRHGAATALHGADEPLRGTGRTHVLVRGPEQGLLASYLTECAARPSYLRSDANQYSLLLELIFGGTRIVLPGDLPRTVKGTPVPTGWDAVLARCGWLCEHTGLKVPHHGSAEAIHPDLMCEGARPWVVTPYNRSRLPRVADMEGLPTIVARNGSVQLTGVPASKCYQASTRHPARLALTQLASRIAKQPTGISFIDSAAVEVTPGDAVEPLDALWCLAFDDAGGLRARYRGRTALDVVP